MLTGVGADLDVACSLFSLAQLARERCGNSDVIAPTIVGFPGLSSIHFSPWAEVIRTYAPKPTPDVDNVANEFRRWARGKKRGPQRT